MGLTILVHRSDSVNFRFRKGIQSSVVEYPLSGINTFQKQTVILASEEVVNTPFLQLIDLYRMVSHMSGTVVFFYGGKPLLFNCSNVAVSRLWGTIIDSSFGSEEVVVEADAVEAVPAVRVEPTDKVVLAAVTTPADVKSVKPAKKRKNRNKKKPGVVQAVQAAPAFSGPVAAKIASPVSSSYFGPKDDPLPLSEPSVANCPPPPKPVKNISRLVKVAPAPSENAAQKPAVGVDNYSARERALLQKTVQPPLLDVEKQPLLGKVGIDEWVSEIDGLLDDKLEGVLPSESLFKV
jgi:hypothetical protein